MAIELNSMVSDDLRSFKITRWETIRYVDNLFHVQALFSTIEPEDGGIFNFGGDLTPDMVLEVNDGKLDVYKWYHFQLEEALKFFKEIPFICALKYREFHIQVYEN